MAVSNVKGQTAEGQGGDSLGRAAPATIDEQVHLLALAAEPKRPGEGFFTRVAQTLDKDGGLKAVQFEVKKALQDIDETEPMAGRRFHLVEDAESVITLAKKYGDQTKSLVLFNDTGIKLVLDEQIQRGQREIFSCAFAYSLDWRAWGELFGAAQALDHQKLLRFLIRQQHNMKEFELLDRMRCIRATAQVNLDSEVRLDGESAGVVFKATGDDSIVKFPRKFHVRLPVLDGDVDDEASWVEFEVRVEIVMPENTNQKLGFMLFAPTLNAARRKRIDAEVGRVKEALEGWTIARGSHNVIDRELLREQE